MAPRIKWKGPKRALRLKQDPDAADDPNDPTYNPKAKQPSKILSRSSRVSKKSQRTQTPRRARSPRIKREAGSPSPTDGGNPGAKRGNRRKVKEAGDIQVTVQENATEYRLILYIIAANGREQAKVSS
ncbi:MAG: hypothetical protein Q9157_001826 [Trypethelium eluteriae]